MGCDQVLAQLGDYLEGEAAPEVRQELEYHVAHCRKWISACSSFWHS
jgi:Putative zinc-finger